MFRPLGSVITGSVLADVALFLNKDQIQEFALLSPRTNAIFKKNRLLHYDRVAIEVDESKLTFKCDLRTCLEVNHSEMEINLDKEDPVGKISFLLSTSQSMDEFSLNGYTETKTVWNMDEINEQLLKLMFNIKFKNLIIGSCSINVSLSLFMKFIHRHGNILETNEVKLPSELINNKTLRLISQVHIECMNGHLTAVDVNDDILKETSYPFQLWNCSTQLTIKGVKTFLEKFEFGKGDNSFGTLGSDQLVDAIAFEEEYGDEALDDIFLWSVNGYKTISFNLKMFVNQKFSFPSFTISLDKRDEDPLGMVPIPHYFVGPETQKSFSHFEKICNNPDVDLPLNQYHIEYLNLSWEDNEFYMNFVFYNEQPERNIYIRQTNVDSSAAHKIIFGVLRNCVSIDRLMWNVPLTDELYRMLKPISAAINMGDKCESDSFEIQLSSANLIELQKTKNGLFGAFDCPTSSCGGKELLPNEDLILYIEEKFNIDVSLLTMESTSAGSETWLTDKLLHSISPVVQNLSKFSFEYYANNFSARGIKDFMEGTKPQFYEYILGTIDVSNSEEVGFLIEEYKNTKKDWNIIKKIVSRNGQSYCTFVIKIGYGTVQFDIPNRDVAE